MQKIRSKLAFFFSEFVDFLYIFLFYDYLLSSESFSVLLSILAFRVSAWEKKLSFFLKFDTFYEHVRRESDYS